MRTGEGVVPTGASMETNDAKKLMLCFSLMEKPIGGLELGDCVVIAKPDAVVNPTNRPDSPSFSLLLSI